MCGVIWWMQKKEVDLFPQSERKHWNLKEGWGVLYKYIIISIKKTLATASIAHGATTHQILIDHTRE